MCGSEEFYRQWWSVQLIVTAWHWINQRSSHTRHTAPQHVVKLLQSQETDCKVRKRMRSKWRRFPHTFSTPNYQRRHTAGPGGCKHLLWFRQAQAPWHQCNNFLLLLLHHGSVCFSMCFSEYLWTYAFMSVTNKSVRRPKWWHVFLFPPFIQTQVWGQQQNHTRL